MKYKVTLSTDKVVIIQELKMSHQRMASKIASENSTDKNYPEILAHTLLGFMIVEIIGKDGNKIPYLAPDLGDKITPQESRELNEVIDEKNLVFNPKKKAKDVQPILSQATTKPS